MFDVAVIGAGIAGLTCAQQLHQAGYNTVVVDKSRGVGGRAATRRVNGIRADHGLRYLEANGERVEELIEVLLSRNILQLWYESEAKISQYVAPDGMSAIAKFLATNLNVKLNRRVESITLNTDNIWHLTFAATTETLTASSVVVAIPAPQALILLEPLAETILPATFLDSLRGVEFDPCLTAIASYSTPFNLTWKDISFPPNSDLFWIGLDSSKRINSPATVLVFHSSADFARANLEAPDLNLIGQHLLSSAAAELTLPWIDAPDWFQVHRWRYAFPSSPLSEICLDSQLPQPLIFCGDWCGGNLVESALVSGMAAASGINRYLKQLPLPGNNFLHNLG
ncbi:NAD(P)/FAD-dependent oxidoreductase [Microseira sp. BLCC-F43]|uniref:NAD(P)/FAD-dependent oxidoreductase n=1 Tax=Microseira sp. BLCC-F43 TaxID=3153602 RepID=UPI0035B9172C